MKKDTEWGSIAKGIAAISQLGLSVITPILLCVLLGTYLKNKFGIPDIILVLLIFLGIASGISSAAIFLKGFLKQNQKEEQHHNSTHSSERR